MLVRFFLALANLILVPASFMTVPSATWIILYRCQLVVFIIVRPYCLDKRLVVSAPFVPLCSRPTADTTGIVLPEMR